MQTQVLKVETINQKVVDLVRSNFAEKLPVVMPTETVYGLAAPFNDEETIQAIYRIKNRPSDNPLIVHISNYEQLNLLIASRSLNQNLEKALARFWPGALTVLFEKSELVSEIVTAGSEFVAVRMPSHPIFKGIIEDLNVPLVAPSANLSSKPSPTKASDALEDLNGLVGLVIDGGEAEFGLESTVIKVVDDSSVKILRPGAVNKEMLEEFFETVEYGSFNAVTEGNVESPGLKYKHYSPTSAKVYLVEKNSIDHLNLKKDKDKLICLNDFGVKFNSDLRIPFATEDQMAVRIFALFRELDRQGVEKIYIQRPERNMALLNRVMKAAE